MNQHQNKLLGLIGALTAVQMSQRDTDLAESTRRDARWPSVAKDVKLKQIKLNPHYGQKKLSRRQRKAKNAKAKS